MLGEMRMHGKAKSLQHPPACQNPGYHIGTASLCIDRDQELKTACGGMHYIKAHTGHTCGVS